MLDSTESHSPVNDLPGIKAYVLPLHRALTYSVSFLFLRQVSMQHCSGNLSVLMAGVLLHLT